MAGYIDQMKKISYALAILALLAVFGCGSPVSAATGTGDDASAAKTEDPVLEMAPGEFLPIAVKLTNSGDKKEVLLTVNYEIQDVNGKVFYRLAEEVPVETTVSYVKNIKLPITLPSGRYTAFSKINYPGQEAPAVSEFEFTVNRKILGLFLDQLAILCLVILSAGAGFFFLSRMFIGRRAGHAARLDYSEIPADERHYLELISDIISDARKHDAGRAIELASEIDGLVLDEEEGRVLNVNKDPAEIIALLILKYEKAFRKKIKYQPRIKNGEMKKKLRSIEENLAIARKYFE
jgi:hypothetical protein